LLELRPRTPSDAKVDQPSQVLLSESIKTVNK
jgi:hypothetical protein